MNLYNIKFKNGREMQEYGDSVADVQEFLKRSYAHEGAVESIVEA